MQTKRTLNIFTDQSHYSRQNRKYLHDMLRPYWYDCQYEQNRQIYGTWIDSYSVTDDIAEADFCLLPMNWTYYNDKDNLEAAYNFVEQGEKACKIIVVTNSGNHYRDIPLVNRDAVSFQTSLYQSQRKHMNLHPLLFSEIILGFSGTTSPIFAPSKMFQPLDSVDTHPTIYFMKPSSGARNFIQAMKYRFGLTLLEPAPLVPSAYFCANILKNRLQQSCHHKLHIPQTLSLLGRT